MRVSQPVGENSWLWLLKLGTGFLVVFLIGLHLVANHLVAEGGLMSYAEVAAYLRSPGIAVLEVAFLVIVVTHALLGLRSVLLDLRPAGQTLAWIDRGLVLLGAVSILYGVWLTRLIMGQGG